MLVTERHLRSTCAVLVPLYGGGAQCGDTDHDKLLKTEKASSKGMVVVDE
jgi:hypothetical protein